MPWFRRKGKATSSTPAPAEAQRATLQHFGDFARTRPGVEAYIEPATHVTQTTMVLIATSGEWTRRRVPVSYTHLRAHETRHDLVCRLLLEKKKKKKQK